MVVPTHILMCDDIENSKNKLKAKTNNDDFSGKNRLPPLEPANAPLPVPEYIKADEDVEDNYYWDQLPDIDSYYLDERRASGMSEWSETFNTDGELDRACSSLESWGEDEFDQATSKRVAEMFAEIDNYIYEGRGLETHPQLVRECKDWRSKCAHLRVTGNQVLATDDKGYKLYPREAKQRPPSAMLSAEISQRRTTSGKSIHGISQLEIQGRSVEPQISPRKMKKREETLAEHGTFEELIAFDNTDGIVQIREGSNGGSRKPQVLRGLMDKLWPEIIKHVLPILINQSQSIKSFRDRRHSEPLVLYETNSRTGQTDKQILIGRKSPTFLLPTTTTNSRSHYVASKNRPNMRSVRLSAPKRRHVTSVGAGRTDGISVSTGLPRRLNPVPQQQNSPRKKVQIEKVPPFHEKTHFSKLPPIDKPPEKSQSAKTSKAKPKIKNQSLDFDGYNLSPRKPVQKLQQKSEVSRKTLPVGSSPAKSSPMDQGGISQNKRKSPSPRRRPAFTKTSTTRS